MWPVSFIPVTLASHCPQKDPVLFPWAFALLHLPGMAINSCPLGPLTVFRCQLKYHLKKPFQVLSHPAARSVLSAALTQPDSRAHQHPGLFLLGWEDSCCPSAEPGVQHGEA